MELILIIFLLFGTSDIKTLYVDTTRNVLSFQINQDQRIGGLEQDPTIVNESQVSENSQNNTEDSQQEDSGDPEEGDPGEGDPGEGDPEETSEDEDSEDYEGDE